MITEKTCTGELTSLSGPDFYAKEFYVIHNYELLSPFFMSIISSEDHWLFISSSGGLSAGRKDADNALFPYYTDDKIAENFANTGSKTLIWANQGTDKTSQLWQPFSPQKEYQVQRNLYKSIEGDQLIFEESNLDLGLRLRVLWTFSKQFGLVRHTCIDSKIDQNIRILDGVQNILAAGIDSKLQAELSNLLNAYKKNEQYSNLLGIFTLNAILSDRAEPSESLLATSVWSSLPTFAALAADKRSKSTNTTSQKLLLSSAQIPGFINAEPLENEEDTRGQRASYLVEQNLELKEGNPKAWFTVAELRQSHSDIVALQQRLENKKELEQDLVTDIQYGRKALRRIVGAVDGLQYSADRSSSTHHFANALFNTMRGGYFPYAYKIPTADFLRFVKQRSSKQCVAETDISAAIRSRVSAEFLDISELEALCLELYKQNNDPDILRLYYEYLPLTFSRRHGDPSRPWNHFSIDIREADGSDKIYYQGNWRDIFQNWEALCLSFPKFIPHIIVKFLNASTADGYNPYRITSEGVDWEQPEHGNPEANIGYWGDHQLIYLLKLLEWAQNFAPESLVQLAQQKIFCCANIPYRIRPFEELLQNPKDSIVFDWDLQDQIDEKKASLGADAQLLWTTDSVYYLSLTEKLLITVLTKLSNMIPGSGIWLNTQRPEWNDANNALVGNGVSVVTLCYLRRFLAFWRDAWAELPCTNKGHHDKERNLEGFEISQRTWHFWQKIRQALACKDEQVLFQQLGEAGSEYRSDLYNNGADTSFTFLNKSDLLDFLSEALHKVDAYIRQNRRSDGLYHSYNLVRFQRAASSLPSFETSHLYEMLEGQVAVLSSGLLGQREAIEVLDAMRTSALYRPDQKSYMLYPYRKVPRFLEKNCIAREKLVQSLSFIDLDIDSNLMKTLQRDGILQEDQKGLWHFHSSFHNARELHKGLKACSVPTLSTEQIQNFLDLYEETFAHREFTGRSGTFFAYEGLGSIYWHMISKLLLATAENIFSAVDTSPEQKQLQRLYYQIREGLGFNKTPIEQGAFPLDPYSHTPWSHSHGPALPEGAKQPGMTGQVKEEILTRMLELGIEIRAGRLYIRPILLRRREFFAEAGKVCHYFNSEGQEQQITLPANTLMFTLAQVPFIYYLVDNAEEIQLKAEYRDGNFINSSGNVLPDEIFQALQQRNGSIQQIQLQIPSALLQLD